MTDNKFDLRAGTASRVKSIIATFFGVSPDMLKDETVVDDINGWDSTSHVGLMITLEDELEIQFAVERITAFENVGELIDECAALLEK
jgi:acyl carrier protein